MSFRRSPSPTTAPFVFGCVVVGVEGEFKRDDAALARFINFISRASS